MTTLKTAMALALAAGLAAGLAAPAKAASCGGARGFDRWLGELKREAAAGGVSRRALSALNGITYDPGVVRRDRAQGVFAQSFLKFAGRMVSNNRLVVGRKRLRQNARTFSRIKQRFGVPAPVITAFWGLETDFGAFMGNFHTLRSLATLARDCRRPELFRPQLIDALRLIDKGDLRASEMIGAWAGELGQLQFLPSDYMESAVDFDGDGRRNLIRSSADALASAANLMRRYGWRRGEPWLEEVRVPRSMPWDQADISIRHSRAQWAKWGVRKANGSSLKADRYPASLILPMGRLGPAFLAYPNFQVYLKWNESLVYTTTAAYFATRLAGAPRVRPGNGSPEVLGVRQIKHLQRLLQRRGFDVGKVDGIIGAKSRAAIKAMQIKYRLPADSYPTTDLINRLQRG
ncbi:MAG: lytic murein transglycosylase [Hyphomicrobiales bacterium]|nr:MAG: lytic murein transglycosylase [Hyphomicrobiales bacterium]